MIIGKMAINPLDLMTGSWDGWNTPTHTGDRTSVAEEEAGHQK
jgi:hypothetical protein